MTHIVLYKPYDMKNISDKINLMLLTSGKLLVAMIHRLLFKTDPKN